MGKDLLAAHDSNYLENPGTMECVSPSAIYNPYSPDVPLPAVPLSRAPFCADSSPVVSVLSFCLPAFPLPVPSRFSHLYCLANRRFVAATGSNPETLGYLHPVCAISGLSPARYARDIAAWVKLHRILVSFLFPVLSSKKDTPNNYCSTVATETW